MGFVLPTRASLFDEKRTKGEWHDGEKQQAYRNALRFVNAIGPDRPVDEIERSEVVAWLGSLKKSDGKALAPLTRNNIIGAVSMLFGHAVIAGWIQRNPALNLRADDPRADHERRDAFTLDELQAVFGPVLVSWYSKTRASGQRWTAREFVPLLMVGTGMREGEAAQLAVEDVFEVEPGLWVAEVKHDVEDQGRGRGRRKAKTRGSRRKVPLHPEILRRGFLDFVARRKALAKSPTEPLFPEMVGENALSSFSQSANTVLLRDAGVKRESTALYSLKHSFLTELEHADVPERARKQFVGHSGGSDAHSGYIKDRELRKLVESVWPVLDAWLPQVFKNLKA